MIPKGLEKLADLPVASVEPGTPDPAILEIAPVAAVIFRNVLFPESTIRRLLLPSIAMSLGLKNLADAAVGESVDPGDPANPAIVSTVG